MESCLYEGRVRHRRSTPVEHAFELPLCMLYLDLDELPGLFDGCWLWSAGRRPALARFHRSDHLGDPDRPLDECVRDEVEARSGTRPRGPIRLLTHPRYAGFAMNPVSFFYCFDAHGGLEALLAEVTSTPWGERHCYVLRPGEAGPVLRGRTPKQLHVSPFMPMQLDYVWQVPAPGPDLTLRIASASPDGTRLFEASLHLERRALDAAGRARALLRHPLMTLQVWTAIHWQALRLWAKRAPYFPHPGAGAPLMETTS